MTTTSRPGHPVFAALYGLMSRQIEAGPIGQARRELIPQAHGVVVDIGAGLGVNLALLGDQVTHVHLVEPDPHMVKRLRPVIPADATIHQAGAEQLPLDDASADTVLATLMLCTVSDLAAAVSEIRRVLKPGGRLLVLEHVRAQEPGLARWQDRLDRPWGWFAAGCHPNRDTSAALAQAGFDVTGLNHLTIAGQPIVRPWITGVLTRE